MTLQEIARAIIATRQEFGMLFLQAQIEHGLGLSERDRFEAIGLDPDDTEAFTKALQIASTKGWLQTLLRLLIDRGRHDGALIVALQELDPTNQALQAITNPLLGFGLPTDAKRIAGVMQWTAKVIVTNRAGLELKTGTGVLVGAHLVLTAWHVVASLFDGPDTAGEYHPRVGSHEQLSVVFDYRLTGSRNALLTPHKVGAHPNWCVAFSACHADELLSQLPTNLAQLEGKWDYAVIRLAGTPGQERRWAPLVEEAEVPVATSRMFLFQHAAGQPLTYCPGAVSALHDPNLANIVPRLRFLHDINTVGGSSGGPCFDRSFVLFGIHQGVWPAPANGNASGNGATGGAAAGGGAVPVFNRGVPIRRVRESIRVQLPELPAPNPEDNLVWEFADRPGNTPSAVIGCDELQTLTWRAAMNRSPRIIHITGEEFSGKTFRLDLLSSLLHEGGHLKLPLVAVSELRKGPLELAQSICRLAGAQLKSIESPTQLVSTTSEWLKNELVPAVIEALKTVRDGRLVWLLLRDLNHVTAQGDGTSDFLFALYECVMSEDWLRIALDGMPRDVPFGARSVRVTANCALPKAADLESYLKRSIAAGGQTPPEDQVRTLADLTIEDFAEYRAEERKSALSRLGQRLVQIRKRLEKE